MKHVLLRRLWGFDRERFFQQDHSSNQRIIFNKAINDGDI